MCEFIFCRLRKRVHASIASEVNKVGTMVEFNPNNTIQLSIRRCQHSAMLLIVVFFNIYLLPYLSGSFLNALI